MPTYEYECTKCGSTFERFQQMTAKPLKKCPECEGAIRRLIGTGASVILKGATSATNSAPCCGTTNPCDSPKRCCGH